MNKEDLLNLGLSEEQAEKVLSTNAEQLKGFIPKSRFDEVNNTKKQLEKDLKDRDVQLENLKNSSGDVETMKQTVENLQRDNKAASTVFRMEYSYKFEIHLHQNHGIPDNNQMLVFRARRHGLSG